MTPFARLRAIPISYRVPLLVALLMMVISGVLSERVLDRLHRTQEASLEGLAGSYLDGLSGSLLPAVLRDDVWETFDVLDRAQSVYGALSPIETIVTTANGTILAASDPVHMPSFAQLPEEYLARYTGPVVTIDADANTGFARRELLHQGQTVGIIHASFDVSHIFAERREILATLFITNGLLAALFALGGFLIVRHMIAPTKILEDHMRAAADGLAAPIPHHQFPTHDGEVARLFRGYNALVQAEQDRAELAARLAEEEKLVSLGRLASGMAHEINNPLGGLFNAIDTLKTHGLRPGVRETSLSLVERGLEGIRDVVQAALTTYRPERAVRPLSPVDLEDIRLLMRPELRQRRQHLKWNVRWPAGSAAPVPAGPVRQAVLNLLLNASAATPERGQIELDADWSDDALKITVSDEGPGMPAALAAILTRAEPGANVRPGHGLGLWTIRRTLGACGGHLQVRTGQHGGTSIIVILPIRESARNDRSNAA
ncbi:HAMP domain-containing sensor histidine kinase [Rhizobium sp. EC-SD404]|uniref:sensor histidine kinase n=1 Tax=Rhizobium sp. EC-SD404 TaxID=2038389 RepID=UPI00125632D0|nr:HAMP domain-containing sensor histidine kinase [Rhizobium sp. EC-SD404]VVS98128.1 Histidine kinase [Rhizobium sp. EC-SD404]